MAKFCVAPRRSLISPPRPARPLLGPEAVRGVDLVVVTLPEKNIRSLPAGLFADTPEHVGWLILATIIRANATADRSDRGGLTGKPVGGAATRPAGDQGVQYIYAGHLLELGRPKGAADRIALPVAGDDPAAKAVVLKLIHKLGFDGVDAGGLDESWRQQPGTPVYTKDFDAEGVRRVCRSQKRPYSEWRATPRVRKFHRASLSAAQKSTNAYSRTSSYRWGL